MRPEARRRTASAGIGAALLILPGAASALTPQDASASLGEPSVEELMIRQIDDFTPAMAAVLVRDGEIDIAQTTGASGFAPDDPLRVDHLLPFPALTPVLLAATVFSLDAAGLLDADAPIATYTAGLDPGVGRITLRQLLSDTAGLDDAARMEGESWEQTLDRIDDRALVSVPGVLYSRSRHSLPLAARVIGQALGRPFTEVVTSAILSPMGLSASTFDLAEARARGLVVGVVPIENRASIEPAEVAETLDGLPVLFTTTAEAIEILVSLTLGDFASGSPDVWLDDTAPAAFQSGYMAGMLIDAARGPIGARGSSNSFGFSTRFAMVPETRSALVVWMRGESSSSVVQAVTDRLFEGSAAGAVPPSGSAGAVQEVAPEDRSPERWVGEYVNGHLKFELRARDGRLVVFDGRSELIVECRKGGTVAAILPDGRTALQFVLFDSAEGVRYLYRGNLAYRHAEDPLGLGDRTRAE